MPSDIPDFIVIDDSRLDCFIYEKIIQNICGQSKTVISFSEASKALDFIKKSPVTGNAIPTVVLLDIQMPVMNGFDFAEAFEKLSFQHKSGYAIFMVSSSTNESDRIRIGNYPSIRELYKKPLNKNIISELIAQVSI